MVGLVETRWRRYGKDRVYVRTVDGVEVGHVDLVAGCVVASVAGFEVELDDCLGRWTEQLADAAAAAPPPAASVVGVVEVSAVGIDEPVVIRRT